MTQVLTGRPVRWAAKGVPDELAVLDDHDLLAGGVVDQVVEAAANGRRWARLVELHRRREDDEGGRHAVAPHFTLTPRQAVVAEVSELWGWRASWVRRQLNVALCLSVWFPRVWDWCLAGSLDGYRASMIADAARLKLDDPLQWRSLAERLEPWLADRHLKTVPGAVLPDGSPMPPVVGCTTQQLRNKLDYEVKRLVPAASEAAHAKAVEERAVRRRDPVDGTAVGWLGISHTVDQLQTAEHALTLAARQLRDAGDERTLDQLRADVAIDRLIGRADGVAVPAFARPVVNVTVPYQTVAGIADDPGMLSGGQVIPAGLARAIAADPSSTWYRMLVDPAGQMVELSTTSYAPTPPIWRHVVAQWGGCFRPGCEEPATTGHYEHRVPWPHGATTARNGWPACEEDHKVKHAPGFSISQDPHTGRFVLHTAAGFSHHIPIPTHPVCGWDLDLPEAPEVQISGSELLHALHHVLDYRESDVPCRPDLEWECGDDSETATIIRHLLDQAERGEALPRLSESEF
jgi:hypothetical protein